MKSKILTLIIGILIGAIVTAAGFLIYQNVSDSNNEQQFDKSDMQGGGRQFDENMMDGNMVRDKNMMDENNTPPDIPDGEASTESSS